MKTKNTTKWICRLKKEESILAPKTTFIDHVAILGEHILGCGGGKLFQRSSGKWHTEGQRDCVFKENGRKLNVAESGGHLVLLSRNESCDLQLSVFNPVTQENRRIPLKYGAATSTVLCGFNNGHQHFYISNQNEKVVHHLNQNGELIRNVGGEELSYPYSMALGASGDVIVSDWLKNDVIVFGPGDTIKRRLSQNNGFTTDNVFCPYGVATDKCGFIFVSSWRENKILLFSPSGDLIQTLLGEEEGVQGPTNITTKDGRLVFANCHGTQICQYGYRITERKQKDVGKSET